MPIPWRRLRSPRVSETVELLQQLVAIESVNPTLVSGGAGELEIGRFVAAWLEERGIDVELDELAPGRANVVGRVRGTGSGPTLLLNAHLDTVGLGGADGGLEPRVEGRRLYGRGSYDMKGGLAAIMLAASRVVDLRLAGDVVVTAVADEEDRSIGSARLAEAVRAAAAIVTEPTDMRLAIAQRGFVWLEVETEGRAAHGSRYDLGIDAIARMGPVLTALGELDERLRLEGQLHPLLGGASLHASLIEGGTELSTYPDRCLVTIERRTLPGETVGLVEEQLRGLPGHAAVRTLFVREPMETPPDASAVLGEPPEIVGVPFWTDAALFAAAGIPTVVFGPSGEGAHAKTEWVDLDDVERMAEILLRTATEFCT
jgi:acetylornithine deacetylase